MVIRAMPYDPALSPGEWLHPAGRINHLPPPKRRYPAPIRTCPCCALRSETNAPRCPVCDARFEPRRLDRVIGALRRR